MDVELNDLVAQLRLYSFTPNDMHAQAADEIELLREKVEALREVLRAMYVEMILG